MSDKSPPSLRKRVSGFIERVFSRSASAAGPSSRHPRSPKNDTGKLDVSSYDAEKEYSPTSTLIRKSISDVSIHSSADTLLAQPPNFPPQLSPQTQTSAYQGPSHSQRLDRGPFSHAHDFMEKEPGFLNNKTTGGNVTEKLLEATINGAEFDSSDRDLPQRCHPGTRLGIIERCLNFITDCSGKEKLRWVVGPAGVGKSAVMESVTEETPEDVISASVFLSIDEVNERQDGAKIIVTIAYQLADKCAPYRQFIRDEIGLDPCLLRESLSVQFNKFIVEPFTQKRLFKPSKRFLIAIDGLDECDDPLTPQILLDLISDFCITYPASPIAWIVSSRPEPHITSFFDRTEVEPAYTKEEMEVGSDEARGDVRRFLRAELKKIKDAYPTLKCEREWPSGHEFSRIAAAAGGFFAYASAVVRYIGDPEYRNPTARLRHVMGVINRGSQYRHASGSSHPMAQLDVLYTRILSNIPADVMANTRKLLFNLCSCGPLSGMKFRKLCNLLELSEDAAYAAIDHLHAVVRVPEPGDADHQRLSYFHRSFRDFLWDFQRSGFCHDLYHEANELAVKYLLKIVEQVPIEGDGTTGEGIQCHHIGYLKGAPASCGGISLTWPGDERFQKSDDQLRLNLYWESMFEISVFPPYGVNHLWKMSCFHVLTTRFVALGSGFSFVLLRQSIFGEFRRELTDHGKLKQVPLRTLDYAAICRKIKIRFTSPIGMYAEHSNPRKSPCKHIKRELPGLQQREGWSTAFHRFFPLHWGTEDDVADADDSRFNIVAYKETHRDAFGIDTFSGTACDYCSRRFARHLTSNPDQPATIFVDSTEMCYVEFSFVDPDDGVSEWTYWFCHSGLPKYVDFTK